MSKIFVCERCFDIDTYIYRRISLKLFLFSMKKWGPGPPGPLACYPSQHTTLFQRCFKVEKTSRRRTTKKQRCFNVVKLTSFSQPKNNVV